MEQLRSGISARLLDRGEMNAAEFRSQMALLPEPPDTHAPPHWQHWRRQMWLLAQSDDVSNFWNWPPIYHTMLVDHFPIGRELLYLQEDWARWESVVSDPTNEANQRNLIMQSHHIRRWEVATGRHVDELDTILEIGGGYGALALVCHRLGFRGTYAIADLPEFALLQKYWLGQHGVPIEHIMRPIPNDLLIALYSISEIPISARAQWLDWSDSYLFLYSSQWADINNLAWMRDVISGRQHKNWHEEQYIGRPDHYAIGWTK